MKTKSFSSQDSQVAAVAQAVADLVEAKETGTFNLVVTGGGLGMRTIEQLGKLVSNPERLRIIFSDERFVESDSPDRTEAQAIRVWPSIIRCKFLRYPQPTFSVQDAAVEFSKTLLELFGPVSANSKVFDLVLLGVGEDGHVASLFPHSRHASSWVVAESDSPKPPKERLSLSYEALNRAERVWFVVAGESKIEVMKKIQSGENLPASKVHGSKETIWWLDQAISDVL